MSFIEMKEWDTLSLSCEYTEDDGTPINLTDICIGAEIRKFYGGTPIFMKVVIVDSAGGKFILEIEKDRLLPSNYKVDLLFQDKIDLATLSSETFGIKVLPAITTPEALQCQI